MIKAHLFSMEIAYKISCKLQQINQGAYMPEMMTVQCFSFISSERKGAPLASRFQRLCRESMWKTDVEPSFQQRIKRLVIRNGSKLDGKSLGSNTSFVEC